MSQRHQGQQCGTPNRGVDRIIDLMDRLGVPFNRTGEGFLDRRRFGGTLYKRTAFAGATTGQQLLYALDEQVRRWEVEGLVKKYEFWDFLGPIVDGEGICRGCVGQDLVSMQGSERIADLALCIRCTSQPRSAGLRMNSIKVDSKGEMNTIITTSRLQNHAGPGPNSQPPISRANSAGDTRLRRRLSKSFHLDKAESGFGWRLAFDPSD